jgi:hypothetical protein
MQYDRIAPKLAELNALRGIQSSGDVNALQQHIVERQVQTSDIASQIGRLREQQARANEADQLQLEKPISDLEHENAVAVADLLERKLRIMSQTTVQPPHEALFDRSMLEKTGTAVFTLMIPIAIALARRIWVRSSPRLQPVAIDLESSPRLQRLEEAIDSIAIEVERIGEAQRFATKLLTERSEPAMNRAVPAPAPIARRVPGTITPH